MVRLVSSPARPHRLASWLTITSPRPFCRRAAVAVRDSKDPAGPKLLFTPAAWAAFTSTIRTGALDRV